MNGLKSIFFLTFFAFSTSAALGAKGAKLPVPPSGKRKAVSERKRMEQIYFFSEGKKRLFYGDASGAAYCFDRAIKSDPYCDACYYELSNAYAMTNQLPEAVQLARSAYALDSGNVWYVLRLAQFCARSGNSLDAQHFFEKAIAENPQITEAYYSLLAVYDSRGLYDKAVRLLMQRRQSFGADEMNRLSMQNFLFKQGKVNEAIDEVQQLIHLYPSEQQYRLLLAELYGEVKADSLALGALMEAKRLDSTSYEYLASLSDYYRQTSNFDKYFNSLLQLFSGKEMPALRKQQVLAFLRQFPSIERNYISTMDSLYVLARATYSYRQEELFAAYLVQTDRIDRAIGVLKLMTLRGENDSHLCDVLQNGQKSQYFPTHAGESLALYSAWQLYFDLLLFRQEWALLEHEADRYVSTLPDKHKGFYVKGLSCFQQKNYDGALSAFLQAQKSHTMPTDTAFLLQLYSSLGDVYFYLKSHAKSDKYFDMALRLDASSYSIMNNYAYYLSLSNRKLKKALKMSLVAINAEPENPVYLDTYAWILYCMGKYDDSKQIFRQALVKGGDKEPVMLEHYGDVLYKLKEYSNALIYWQRVVENGGDSPELREKINKAKSL
ncbi:MAG: tetratricopeptide repeat protein [Prevotellaceae bacterium]|jgi:tetratricopeptide (TPR) repeat protein|nr:tetratricopeptide repeat protein [Prevotellaceae bacterium]